MQLKAGTRLRSAVDACEVVVVRAPGEPVDLRCGGHPFLGVDEEASPVPLVAGFDVGTQLGKRYADEGSGLEVLCTKAGHRLHLRRRRHPRGQGSQTAPGLGLTRDSTVNIAMLVEMVAEGDPERTVVGRQRQRDERGRAPRTRRAGPPRSSRSAAPTSSAGSD